MNWGPVDCIHQNGDIIGYSVQYRSLGSRSTQTIIVAGDATTETIITNLDPTTTYSIEVAAVNSVGTGVYSAIIYANTKGILIIIIYMINLLPLSLWTVICSKCFIIRIIINPIKP